MDFLLRGRAKEEVLEERVRITLQGLEKRKIAWSWDDDYGVRHWFPVPGLKRQFFDALAKAWWR